MTTRRTNYFKEISVKDHLRGIIDPPSPLIIIIMPGSVLLEFHLVELFLFAPLGFHNFLRVPTNKLEFKK